MTVLLIGVNGEHHYRALPADLVAYGYYREMVSTLSTPLRARWLDAPAPTSTVNYREYKRYTDTYGGTPVFATAPWVVREAMATDICTDHPDHISLSESLVREHVYRLCDAAGEWHRVDDRQTIEDFSKPQRLKRVEYRILVQVRER